MLNIKEDANTAEVSQMKRWRRKVFADHIWIKYQESLYAEVGAGSNFAK